ncbi:helix-turn-helix transcriptional regulator [Paenibacillus dauci]|uniref:helix-turn-helix transcriptional regulator n=1 Tax=Paenibacillus dauci TaxID=1567106 RepID=UPI000619D16E|nr:AraC family transcriptional regulator [Paenibacillus dauci]
METLEAVGYSVDPQESMRIHYLRQIGYSAMPRYHSHASYEIFYVQDGGRTYFINETAIHAAKGDLVFICPTDLHRTVSTDALLCERILVNFTEEFIREGGGLLFPLQELGRDPLYHLPFEEQHAVQQCLQEMLSEMQRRDAGYIEYSRCLLTGLLIRLYRIRRREHGQPAAVTSVIHPMETKITEIARYINDHFDEPLTLQGIAELFYISPSYLCRIFPRITGFHFREYLQTIRLRAARELLRHSTLSVAMIAERTGYAHTANFSVIFKKLTGCTPSQYRIMNRQKRNIQ